MQQNNDKCARIKRTAANSNAKKNRIRRAACIAGARNRLIASRRGRNMPACKNDIPVPKGYDPEMIYVECERCGSPVIWKKGYATALMALAAMDPLELDASCVLVTDGCPSCGMEDGYTVKMYRILQKDKLMSINLGHA